MAPTRRQFLGVATAATVVGLSGCTGDGTGTPNSSPTDTPTESPTDAPTTSPPATTEDMAAATVAVDSHPDHGDILVDAEGMTLYMFDQDTQGEGASACGDGCVSAWPPLTTESEANAGDAVSATLSTFERADGGTQVAANGWPLYYYGPDEEPGDATGQGVNDVWWVLDPAGRPQRGGSTDGGDSGGPGGY